MYFSAPNHLDGRTELRLGSRGATEPHTNLCFTFLLQARSCPDFEVMCE